MLSPPQYWCYPLHVLMLSPTVLNNLHSTKAIPTVLNNLYSTEGIPHSTDGIPRCTEQPPMYWTTSTVLNWRYMGWFKLRHLIFHFPLFRTTMENLIQSFPTPSYRTCWRCRHWYLFSIKSHVNSRQLLWQIYWSCRHIPFSLTPPLAFKIFIFDPTMDKYFCGDPP